MERGRVVYYAKNRTAKVLSPLSAKHHLCTSPLDDVQAPLACVESDMILTRPAQSGTSASGTRAGTVIESPPRPSLPFFDLKTSSPREHEKPFLTLGKEEQNGVRQLAGGSVSPSDCRIFPGPVLKAPPTDDTKRRPPRTTPPTSLPVKPHRTKVYPILGNCREMASSPDSLTIITTVNRSSNGYTRQTVVSNSPLHASVQQGRVVQREARAGKPDLTSLPAPRLDNCVRTSREHSQQSVTVSNSSDKPSQACPDKPSLACPDKPSQACPDKPSLACPDKPSQVCPDEDADSVLEWTVNEHNAIVCRKVSLRSSKSGSTSSSQGSTRSSSDSTHDTQTRADPASQTRADPQMTQEPGLLSPQSSWKRNSLRLATHGFSSMSDLSNSVECLKLFRVEGEDKPTNLSGKSLATVLHDDVLYSSNGQIFTFFEQSGLSSPEDDVQSSSASSRSSEYVDARLNVSGDSAQLNSDPPTPQGEQAPRVDGSKETLVKRRSYILATCSISDLTCDPEDDVDGSPTWSQKSGVRSCSLPRRTSLTSNQLNSSFGSFYSCRSLDFVKRKESPQQDVNDSNSSAYFSLSLNGNSRGAASSRGQDSENTSMYYTASDTSFSEASTSSHTKDPTSSPRRFWRKPLYLPPASNAPQISDHGVKVSHAKHLIPAQKIKAPKPLKRLNNVFHCYGCGFDPGHLSVTARRKSSEFNTDRRHSSTNMHAAQKPGLEPRSRCYTAPSSAGQDFRQSLPHSRQQGQDFRHPMAHSRQLRLELPTRESSLSSSISVSPSSDSDSDWQDTPRSPPALGRPKRKVYAGFDSQPLPMDSFMSDSSSIYTDCGSWSSRSRSAEVSRNSLAVSENLSTRAVSDTASGMITPRQMSQDSLIDYFRFSDKKSVLRENNHNVFVSMDKSEVKDTFENKRFSSESLDSNLSTVTTTGLLHRGSRNNSCTDMSRQPIGNMLLNDLKLNNSRTDVTAGEKRTNEEVTYDGDRKFRLTETNVYPTGSGQNLQQRPLKAELICS
ncbi:mucin-2-like [Physella acuta]|uniref:mucin-2-like n=1 Tax=Physella acuta TaxID=109671 RepID=UPI0027DD4A74|nr:mucin-2-like [Physella acuta]